MQGYPPSTQSCLMDTQAAHLLKPPAGVPMMLETFQVAAVTIPERLRFGRRPTRFHFLIL